MQCKRTVTLFDLELNMISFISNLVNTLWTNYFSVSKTCAGKHHPVQPKFCHDTCLNSIGPHNLIKSLVQFLGFKCFLNKIMLQNSK